MYSSQFTDIPRASFDAIVKEGFLTEVLLAMAVDPLDAADIGDAIVAHSRSPMSIIIDTGNEGEPPYKAPISPRDFWEMGHGFYERMKVAISEWCDVTPNATDGAAERIALWNRNFAVYTVAVLASESFRDDPMPSVVSRGLGAVLRLAQGRGGWQEVQQATEEAWNFTQNQKYGSWERAMASAVASIGDAAIRQSDVAPQAIRDAVRSIARANAYNYGYRFEGALEELRDPLSRACLAIPPVPGVLR